MVNRDPFSLLEWSLSLARTASIGQIATLGIEPLGRTIRIKETDRDACLRRASRDQLLSHIHQA